jgi:hypothetical protein
MNHHVTRRTVLKSTALAGAAAAAGAALPAASASAAARRRLRRPGTSANGWTIQTNVDRDSQVWTRRVAGTGLSVALWIGDVETILLHVVRRFHYEIEQISAVDLVGWTRIAELQRHRPESNLASGTAVRIRPGARARGGFYPLQQLVLRDALAECEGVVRWGGDDRQVDESLFSIAVGPHDARVQAVAQKLRGWSDTPGKGAGTSVDVLSPGRRRRAADLARIQRS